MTLDLEKFISNSIKTQAKIQHLDVSTKTTKSVPKSIKDIIASEYGENYILDADYMSFFWGDIGKEEVKKLFNVVDKALGKSANKLTETDFKKLDISGDSQSDNSQDEPSEDEPSEDEPSEDEPSEDEQSSDDQSDEVEDDNNAEVDNSLDNDSNVDTEMQDDSATNELNEEDDEEIEKSKKTNYFFLKITLK